MPLFRYAVKPTLASVFIAPLLDGIGSHDCTTFRSETYAHFGFITPLRLSPHHASIILTQNTYSCSTAYPIPTHAEQICFALVKPLKGERCAIVLAETTSCLVVSARTTAILPSIVTYSDFKNQKFFVGDFEGSRGVFADSS